MKADELGGETGTGPNISRRRRRAPVVGRAEASFLPHDAQEWPPAVRSRYPSDRPKDLLDADKAISGWRLCLRSGRLPADLALTMLAAAGAAPGAHTK